MRTLGDARFTGRAFRSIVGTLLGAAVPLAAITCGGTVSGMDGGDEPDVVDGGGGPKCVPPDAPSNCGATFTVDNCASEMTDAYPDCYKICGGPAYCTPSGTSFACHVQCALDGRRPPGPTQQSSPARTLPVHFSGIT